MSNNPDARFANVYEDAERAAAYATLEYPGTYYLAFRDIPALIAQHATGNTALDFGCGAGRSTRFLKQLGFSVTGIDVSQQMLALARAADPGGSYLWSGPEGIDFSAVEPVDLIFCAFPFDNIPGGSYRERLMRALRDRLKPNGRLVLLGSAPELYLHEWTSFTSHDFPENHSAKNGDVVRLVMRDVSDARPVIDYLWHHDDYVELFRSAGLHVLDTTRPLGKPEEPFEWTTELTVSPWLIYVVKR